MRLGRCRRIVERNLGLAIRLGPVVIVCGRNETQQEVWTGLERVELESPLGFTANRGSDCGQGRARVGRQVKVEVSKEGMRRGIARIQLNGLLTVFAGASER